MFSQQAILKLISANSAWIEEVNEIRKKQKETIRVDINRKKKLLDDIQQSKCAKEDSFQINLLETQGEMSFFRPTDQQFVHMSRKLQATTQAHQNSQGRLLAQQSETR